MFFLKNNNSLKKTPLVLVILLCLYKCQTSGQSLHQQSITITNAVFCSRSDVPLLGILLLNLRLFFFPSDYLSSTFTFQKVKNIFGLIKLQVSFYWAPRLNLAYFGKIYTKCVHARGFMSKSLFFS